MRVRVTISKGEHTPPETPPPEAGRGGSAMVTKRNPEITWVRSGERLSEVNGATLRKRHQADLIGAQTAALVNLRRHFGTCGDFAAEIRERLGESAEDPMQIVYLFCLMRTDSRWVLWVDAAQYTPLAQMEHMPVAAAVLEATGASVPGGTSGERASMAVEDFGIVVMDSFTTTPLCGSFLVTPQYVFPTRLDDGADPKAFEGAATDAAQLLEYLTGNAGAWRGEMQVWRRAAADAATTETLPSLPKVIPASENPVRKSRRLVYALAAIAMLGALAFAGFPEQMAAIAGR